MNPYLMPVLEFGPEVCARLLAQIPTARRDEALKPDRFTAREVIAHLADWEPIMLGRMQTALNSPGATIEAYDEGQMAIDNDYASLDPDEQSRLFISRRAETAAWLRQRTEEELQRAVTHPERGLMTIRDQAGMLIGHDLYHIEQLSAYLRNCIERSVSGQSS